MWRSRGAVDGRCSRCAGRCATFGFALTRGTRWHCPLCSFGKFLWLWVILAVGSSIGTSIVTTNAQQQDLSVPQSDAIADSNNFLQPFRDVFVFFEDGMTGTCAAVGGGRVGGRVWTGPVGCVARLVARRRPGITVPAAHPSIVFTLQCASDKPWARRTLKPWGR